MEFTTPASYDSVKVNVGGIAVDGKIIVANADSTTTHTRTETDSHSALPEPKEITYAWTGKTADGKDVKAQIAGSIGERMDRIDIMAEMPNMLKSIITGATGAQPFIYQVGQPFVIVLRLLLTAIPVWPSIYDHHHNRWQDDYGGRSPLL